MPLLQKFGFTGGFPPSRAPAAPPRGPATRRITLPPAARPEFAAPMTSGPAANGWRRGAGSSGPHNGRARGHMSPIRARRRHCPLSLPRPEVRVSTLRALPNAALRLWGPRSQGWLREYPGASEPGARAPPSQRAVTLCGAARRSRGHLPGARGGRAAPGARVRGRAGRAELSAPPPARLSGSSRISAQEPSERGCERASPARGRGGDHRPALWRRPRPRQWRDIHLAWQLLPRGGGGARLPPYRRAAAGGARSGGGDGDPPRPSRPSRLSLPPPRGARQRRSRRRGPN